MKDMTCAQPKSTFQNRKIMRTTYSLFGSSHQYKIFDIRGLRIQSFKKSGKTSILSLCFL